jgi:Putative porin
MKKWTALAGLAMLGATVTANAAVSDEQFRQMQEKLDQALQRINELEKEGAEVGAAQQAEIDALAASAEASEASKTALVDQVAANTAKIETTMSWADRISIAGDFRYRYQYDDIDEPVNDTRNRNRIRARPVITAMLQPDLLVGFGLASGSDDPVSTNQTLGNGDSSKDIKLDLAYFTWTGIQKTTITGGKFKLPLVTVGGSALQWDSDWRPEGAGIGWTNGTFFANALGNYLESDSNAANGSTFYPSLQAGGNFKLGPVAMTGGVGYTDISTEGKPCFFSTSSGFASGVDLERSFCGGNQARGQSPAQRYANDFGVYNLFAQGTFNLFDLPLAIYADYINNSDADDYETGYQAGVTLGGLKLAGEWQVGYYYQDLESNATLGLLTNSDFGGGGTNGKGSVLSAGYALSDKTNLLATYYLVDKNSDKLASVNNGDDYGYDTLQLDLNFKYK